MVKEMTIRATEVRRKRAIWSMMHDRQTLDDQPEWPFLETIELALAVTAPFDRRSTGVAEVPIQPLLAQHRNERDQQQHQ